MDEVVERMRQGARFCLLLLSSLTLVACVNELEMRKRDAQHFLQNSTGEYVNEARELLFIAPVYARMIGYNTFYVERSTAKGPSQRLVALEPSNDGEKLVQYSYAFVVPAQWREVRSHPELLSALQPNDMRPAGTCDIKLSDDLNSLSYSCGGSPPMNYKRVQHAVEP
jgi:hypothetical protein